MSYKDKVEELVNAGANAIALVSKKPYLELQRKN